MRGRKSLSTVTSKLIGRPYGLCSANEKELDCFTLICEYLNYQEVKRPLTFRGYGEREYKTLFEEDSDAAHQLMVEYIASICKELPVGQEFAGDILLLTLPQSEKPAFLGINGGNGNLIAAAPTYGVVTLPLKQYVIERVFRCQQQ